MFISLPTSIYLSIYIVYKCFVTFINKYRSTSDIKGTMSAAAKQTKSNETKSGAKKQLEKRIHTCMNKPPGWVDKKIEEDSKTSEQDLDDSVIITLVENFPDVMIIDEDAIKPPTSDNGMTYTERLSSTSSECELTVVQHTHSMICPYTKQTMSEPYKNKICGHSYEKKAIEEYIKVAKMPRCPVIGCDNKKKLEMKDIEANKELMNKLDSNNNNDKLKK
ncbi:hypothetical protein ACF0H5_012779 [Mactra antiquata]